MVEGVSAGLLIGGPTLTGDQCQGPMSPEADWTGKSRAVGGEIRRLYARSP